MLSDSKIQLYVDTNVIIIYYIKSSSSLQFYSSYNDIVH